MRVDRYILWLKLVFVIVWLAFSSLTWAQALSAANSSHISDPGNDTINDVFIGKGTKGPYILTWKNVEPQSESVILSTTKLIRGQDYTIDYASGTVVFTEPVPDRAVARVNYRRIPGKSAQNAGGLDMPLSMRLLDSGRGNLDVMGVYTGGDAKGKGAGLSIIGLSSQMKISQDSSLSSTFYVSDVDNGSGGKKADFSDRSAMKLATSTALGKLSLNASFARAGEQFTSAKQHGFQQAKELIDLSGTFGKSTDVVHASFSYKQQEELGGANKGATQTSSEQKIVWNPESSSKFTISRVENEKTGPNGAQTGNAVETLQVDKSFGQKTTASAVIQRKETTSGGVSDELTNMGLNVQSGAIDNVHVKGSFTRRSSDQLGSEIGIDLGMNAAVKRMSFDAAFTSTDSDKNGEQVKRTVGLSANPLDWMQVKSRVVWKESEQAGEETGIDVGLKLSPNKRLAIDASHASTDSEKTGQQSKTAFKVAMNPFDRLDIAANVSLFDNASGQQSTTDVKFAARPLDALRVEGAYAEKQFSQGTNEEQRSVRIEAQPADFIKVSAGIGEREIGNQVQSNREASIEVKAGERINLASSIREYKDGQSDSMITQYQGALKPSKYLEVQGAYKNRVYSATDDLKTKSLQVAMGSVDSLRITGRYSLNPEDKKGNVQRLSSTGLGVELKLGILGLWGEFLENDQYLAGIMNQETEVGMSLALFGHGKLSTGFKLSEAISQMHQSTMTYSLGYTHVIGSKFSLSISGELTRAENESLINDEEYKAEAKLGVKF